MSLEYPWQGGTAVHTLRPIMMRETEIQEYARQLLESHGDKAILVAAQRARSFEEKGKNDDAKTWRRVEDALRLMRGPKQG